MTDPSSFLLDLLEAYSPSGAEAPGVEAFGRVARSLGYAVRSDAVGNGFASKGSGRPQTVYLGHIDTVEGRVPVRREGSRIWGRGACDAKGPLLAALLAGEEPPLHGEFVVVAAVGEETDSRGVRALLPALAPDHVIAGEPGGWEGLSLGYKGDLRLRLTFHGSRTHLSSPLPSTTERAVDWLGRAAAPPSPGRGAFERRTSRVVSVCTTELDGSEAVEAVIDFRLPPGESTRSVLEGLPPVGASDTVDVMVAIEPYLTDRQDPVVRALTAGIRAVGGQPTYFRKAGTSDLNLAAPAWGTGGAAYGPGDSHLDHTDQESLDVEELARAVRVLRYAVTELAKATGPATPRRVDGGGG